MKYYYFEIKGELNDDRARLARDAVKNAIADAEMVIVHKDSISFGIGDDCSISADADERLKIELSALQIKVKGKIETDDRKYIYIGKQKPRRRVGSVICAATVATVVAIMLCLTSCINLFPFGDGETETSTEEVTEGETGDGQDVVINTNVPSYFEDLIKLDEAFKQFSFDGIDEDVMKEAILDAYIAATGDIYAEYLNAEEYADYFTEQSGEFVGIGVSIVNSEIVIGGFAYKVMEIISVFENSPALENDVRVGDCIMYVNNGGEMTLVNELGYTKALDVMLGETGTEAKFIVFRPEDSDYREIEFSITRRKVETQSVKYRVSETDSRVGIVNITGFDLTTPPQFKNAVNTLRDVYGCEYFVFDVRNNPGGSLDSIETVLTYFLDYGDEIITTEYSDGYTETAYARAKKYVSEYSAYDVAYDEIGMYKDLNCIVITNSSTASAAELFTATLRDYGLAKVVGDTTYGKGCMQSILPLDSYGIEGGLKLTVAMYYSMSKTVYHGTGIVPDYPVELSDEAKKINFFLLPEEKDDQLLFAINELVK